MNGNRHADDDLRRVSKFLSLVLRHRPGLIGIELDDGGWVAIDDLIAGASKIGRQLSKELIERVALADDKQRYAIDESGLRIRANQGHSVHVDLGLEPVTPPAVLYHGTIASALDGIQQNGLRSRSRQYVHLSADTETASAVGSRRGDAVILRIDAARMAATGHEFRCSLNGVWLADMVPAEFIDFVE